MYPDGTSVVHLATMFSMFFCFIEHPAFNVHDVPLMITHFECLLLNFRLVMAKP